MGNPAASRATSHYVSLLAFLTRTSCIWNWVGGRGRSCIGNELRLANEIAMASRLDHILLSFQSRSVARKFLPSMTVDQLIPVT